MSKDGWKHSTPRLPEEVSFPECNIANVDQYVQMSTDLPLVDPTDEMHPELYEEEGATWEPTNSERDTWLPKLDG